MRLEKLAYPTEARDGWIAWPLWTRLPAYLGGIWPPRPAVLSMTQQERLDAGIELYDIVTDEVPEGKVATAWTLTDVDGAPHWTPTTEDIPLETMKVRRATDVTARRDQIIAGGVTIDFGGEVGPKVLQTATEYDRSNWLTILAAAQAFAAMGQGEEPMNPIRTLDNTMVPVTVNEAITHMLTMQSKLGQVWLHAATLKDAIAAAEDQAELDAIDIETGWPDPLEVPET